MSLILRDPTLMDFALCAMNLIEEDREQWEELCGRQYNADEAAETCWNFPGPRWAICDETGMALAVAGCRRMRPHVYQSYFISGNELWTHGKKVTEVTSKVMHAMLERDAHRIETLCLEKRAPARAWYEKVGMQFEAVLPYYGATGQNFVQYSRYRTPEKT